MRAFIDFPCGDAPGGRLRACFDTPREVLSAWHPHEVLPLLHAVQAHARQGRWCLGGVAYEAAAAFDVALPTHEVAPGWPLARFVIYDKASEWPVVAADAAIHAALWAFSMAHADYLQRCTKAVEAMAAGECYQINLTGALRAQAGGAPADWMAHLRAAQPEAYLLWLDWGAQQLISASPELFFDWRPGARGGLLRCQPMKGTAPRHADAAGDAQARDNLLASAKERAENVMIVDLLRNDLGRIATPGSVRVPRLFEVQALPTVWQMTSTVTARARPDVGLAEVFTALFPCGSITGAPKARAMQRIRQLEDGPRGFYCGALGLVRPGGAATFNVPIRTLALVQEGEGWQASYGVGSGVTVYADPQAESLELAAKARLLERVSEPFELLETLRLEAGHYGRQERHLARMCESARYFGRAWPAQALQDALARVAQAHPQGLWRVRLLLGEGGAVNAQAFPLAPTTEPVRVALAPQPLDTRGGQHEFILHKTTRRRHYEALAPQDPALFDSLLVNERGEVTEFTRGNLALHLDGRWQTPALACGLLAGTYRAELLAQGRLEEAVFSVDDVRRADALVFFNSLRGWLRAELVPEAPG